MYRFVILIHLISSFFYLTLFVPGEGMGGHIDLRPPQFFCDNFFSKNAINPWGSKILAVLLERGKKKFIPNLRLFLFLLVCAFNDCYPLFRYSKIDENSLFYSNKLARTNSSLLIFWASNFSKLAPMINQ